VDHQFGGRCRRRACAPRAHAHRSWDVFAGGAAALGDVDATSNPTTCIRRHAQDAAIVGAMMGDSNAPFADRAGSTHHGADGCLIGDLNEDGLPDLVVYYWAARRRRSCDRQRPGHLTRRPAPRPTSRWNGPQPALVHQRGGGFPTSTRRPPRLLIGNYISTGAQPAR